MPAKESLDRMLAVVNERAFVRVDELSSRFGVSEVTARNDLSVLAQRGQIRRIRGGAIPRAHLSIATGFFAHGVSAREIVLEFVADPPGYLWSFPRPDHLSIGICAQADAGVTASALRETAARWMRQTGLGAGAELEPYSWPIPSLPAAAWQQPLLGGPGWLLVGDAAGLVDPITREGIFFALQSGTDAAAAVSMPAVRLASTSGAGGSGSTWQLHIFHLIREILKKTLYLLPFKVRNRTVMHL